MMPDRLLDRERRLGHPRRHREERVGLGDARARRARAASRATGVSIGCVQVDPRERPDEVRRPACRPSPSAARSSARRGSRVVTSSYVAASQRAAARRGHVALVHRVLVGVHHRDHLGRRAGTTGTGATPTKSAMSGISASAHSSRGRNARRSRVRGAFENPPTRGETGWISRPPIAAIRSLPIRLICSAFDLGLKPRLRHLDRAVEAEEVGRGEQEDVQHVALDPLAAVQEPPQLVRALGDLGPRTAARARGSRSSGRRPGRSRRSAARCRAPRRSGRPRRNASKKRGGS